MGRVIHMEYPDGWVEDYHYDALGQLTAIEDTDPTGKDMKQQKNVFEYDVCGNMVYEYMRGNGTGESTTEVFYTYDALHRVTSARENYGNAWRNYTYDSLGNLTYEENSNNVQYDYKLNDLNQITEKYYSGGRERTVYTYDGRGNLVLEEYGKNKTLETVASYVYDETNKMVLGTNAAAETSAYLYNGLNALVEQTWVIAKNGYGYHDVDAGDAEVTYPAPNLKKSSTVIKQFVIDYTRETMDPLMEHEVNGLDYRYVYGLERLSVNISPIENGAGHVVEIGTVGIQIRLYYHQDLRGTVDYLTSPVSQKVESWTHYNEWGEITHNAVLKMGLRELDLVKNYTGHDYDAVLNLYYAKARMYDAENRRFLSIDPILDGTEYDLTEYVYEVVNFTAHLYVRDNPLRWVDPLGLRIVDRNITLTMLQDGGGTTAGLDSAAQPSTPGTGGVISGDKAALGKVPQANITPIDPDPQPGPPPELTPALPSSGNNTPVISEGPMEKVECPNSRNEHPNIQNILNIYGLPAGSDVPDHPENSMWFLENIRVFGYFVEGHTIVMDEDKYCEYIFFGIAPGISGLVMNGSTPDVATTAGLVYNVTSPSDYAGFFFGASALFATEAYGGAVAPEGVYAEILGGEDHLAGSLGISITYYLKLSTEWTYGEAPINWYYSAKQAAKRPWDIGDGLL